MTDIWLYPTIQPKIKVLWSFCFGYGSTWTITYDFTSIITPEDVLESLMNDGTVDALRLKIINQLKANVCSFFPPFSISLLIEFHISFSKLLIASLYI